ncbi:hypothetical protein F5Y08DRAFT_334048 [Xylaria arbuscula]|nr:hypothetical protein F5Y08DRAFT_334048 [Xylaria arbuscula]
MSYDFECGTCNKVFSAEWQARDNHLRSTGHRAPKFECDQSHEGLNHFKWDCSKCCETWPTEEQLIDHEHDEHKYCSECERTFNDHNGMKMHLHSRVHCNYQIPCPSCKKSHPMATSLSYHVESGSCPNAPYMNRDLVYKIPSSTQYEATDRSYNPECQVWECFICHKPFNRPQSLNQHLSSPIHQQTLYHCPNQSCGKEFTSLTGLLDHLGSESCGHTRFRKVQHSIQNMMSGNKLITF